MKSKKRSAYLRSIAAALFLYGVLSGCSMISQSRMDTVSVDYTPFDPGRPISLEIDSIEIEYADTAGNKGYPVEEIVSSIGRRYGLSLPSSGGHRLIVSIWIKEARFIRGINSETSITVLVGVRDKESDEEYLNLLYTELSSDTIENFYHLYRVIDICMKRTADVLIKKLTAEK